MSGFGDVKSKKLKNVIKWLSSKTEIRVSKGGRHNIKIKHIYDGAYPLPISHSTIDKHVVKHFADWLIQNNVCTEEEFSARLR